MLINKNGDILKATENIICHQCNTRGIFGGGLAYQIKSTYPNCELSAINHVRTLRDKCDVVGTYDIYKVSNKESKISIAKDEYEGTPTVTLKSFNLGTTNYGPKYVYGTIEYTELVNRKENVS